ncbi:SusC/RagA family TonB-linked outer membrane protein [Marinoscillum furvescens]|uniref:TonB-linked SusC/RagA family outer membrane protein n=1 Tax=Marinoscillum furvescens DSM 4134 TaxID=1122208 RepID=A0A3D9LGL0_MARFU|nr:SusC/RagA family TonB-linked outer membrane protein [Marinoscillum furvescens]REE05501.1 TonB-linked SusC/RagA family outer membrane protein [Marinoscillum furvescens DSM 4134]
MKIRLHQQNLGIRPIMLFFVLLLGGANAVAQSKVTGTITDEDTGESIPGVSILIEGTTTGTVTDLDGKYSLTAPDDATLIISYIGFMDEKIPVNGRSVIDVAMKMDISELEEVVVVGYGVQKKSDVTGALSSIDAETIQERPVQNAIDAMQGKVAGVDIQTNRRPGETSGIQIRGNKSINRRQDVLYVVDGIVLMGDLNDINPNDIQSIDVLKDASAKAIYGSRASNGVVLITTKSGKEGVRVNYNGSVSLDVISSVTDWATAGEMLDRNRQAYQNHPSPNFYRADYPDPFEDIRNFGKNDYQTINAIRQGYEWEDPGTYTQPRMRPTTAEERAKGWPAQVPVYNSGNIPSFDWMDFLTQTGVTHNHNVSVSSGTDKSNIYFSLGYLDQDGAQQNQEYTRYTARINGDVKPTKWLKVGGSIAVTSSKQNYGTVYRAGSATGARDLYGLATGMYPMSEPYDSLGNLNIYPGNNQGEPKFNPLIDLENTQDERVSNFFQTNLFGEIQLAPWLKYRMNFGGGIKNHRQGEWRGRASTLQRSADNPLGWGRYEYDKTDQWMVENIIYVDQQWGIHNIAVTLLHSAQKNRGEGVEVSANGLINDSPRWYNLQANLTGNPSGYGTGFSERSLESYMSRINYSLFDKYLLTATLRLDGSSVLAEGNKWDYFPSAALAWKMEEENFIQNLSFISQMKLRVGVGVVGNQASINPYESSGPLRQYDYIFGTGVAVGYIPAAQPNENLTWEKQREINIGLDYGFLQDRITGSLELYQSDIFDLIFTRPLPAMVGYTEVAANVGSLRNRGIEFNISSVNIDTRNFTWRTTANFSANRESIQELVNGKEDMPGSNLFIGQPVSIFRTYGTDGLWQDTEEDAEEMAIWADSSSINFRPGTWKPLDVNGDYKLDEQDLVIHGSRNPLWTGGLTNTFTYKNWTLSTFLYARVGQLYRSNLVPWGVNSSGFISYAPKSDLSDYWSSDNPDAKYPELTVQNTDANSGRGAEINDGTFFVVRNISVTYNLPQVILNRMKAKKLEIYAQVLNPFLFGGPVVKAGINPDDNGGWAETNSVGNVIGGTNNNRVLEKSYVFGVRLGL